jgi:hypothetical protein
VTTDKNDLLYAKRDVMALDEAGNYYCKHVMAMTAEELHSKSDIAAELAYRDALIDYLLGYSCIEREDLSQLRENFAVDDEGT